MIIGIGTDIVVVSRIGSILERRKARFLEKFFPCAWHERPYPNAQTVAGWFASKEAFIKAVGLGMGYMPLSSICIKYNSYGKPYITSAKIKDNWIVHLSIAHDGELALAFVVIEEV